VIPSQKANPVQVAHRLPARLVGETKEPHPGEFVPGGPVESHSVLGKRENIFYAMFNEGDICVESEKGVEQDSENDSTQLIESLPHTGGSDCQRTIEVVSR
jgi:hypothetical protein